MYKRDEMYDPFRQSICSLNVEEKSKNTRKMHYRQYRVFVKYKLLTRWLFYMRI
jgi:hypothetical protein